MQLLHRSTRMGEIFSVVNTSVLSGADHLFQSFHVGMVRAWWSTAHNERADGPAANGLVLLELLHEKVVRLALTRWQRGIAQQSAALGRLRRWPCLGSAH